MIKKIYQKNKRIVVISLLVLLALVFLIIYFYSFGNKISVVNTDDNFDDISTTNNSEKENTDIPLNNIIGKRCENGNKRPFAVMLAADKVARPLSGVSSADVVVEMPVITDGITRYMALFSCEEPKEIGSIRSARHDFITLANSFDAIYAHWGGSVFALDKLKTGVIDNIDALKNPYNTFYRKKEKRAPHNGFTSFDNLRNTAEKLNFRTKNNFSGYLHTKDKRKTNQNYKIKIAYPSPYDVVFRYDPKTNSYYRYVNSFKEVDSLNNKQVVVKNLIIMRANSKQIKDQYNDVDIESSGKATIYRNGEIIRGFWRHKQNKYYFIDMDKKEIEFTPGKIWISIVQPNQNISIENL